MDLSVGMSVQFDDERRARERGGQNLLSTTPTVKRRGRIVAWDDTTVVLAVCYEGTDRVEFLSRSLIFAGEQ